MKKIQFKIELNDISVILYLNVNHLFSSSIFFLFETFNNKSVSRIMHIPYKVSVTTLIVYGLIHEC